ncbi:alpha/beta hydrolase-fold protein [Olsenella profusa]|uniref:Esterase/lipase superfamily enzyme n=1 Tax=Olsenella profusa TaxID=138595 RepID=A0ABS2F2Y4_9ACTN|nr:alpha/beta hydrolase-fold protein [Olsenella profusa]MBM6775157.1 hypothetical protein [Olsenella profusa]
MDKKNVVCSSAILGREMHVNVYGKKGLPVVMFPTLAASPESVEEAGVIDELADYLDGAIQIFVTETIDAESWASDADPAERAQRQETFYHYVVDELVPLVHQVSKSDARPLALGADMGATHAAIVALRRPDLFQGCVCLSGSYDARRYFGDWMDATLYDNTPCAFLPQMPLDHPYVAVYRQRQLLFCTGQEASEADSLRSTREIGADLDRLGVDNWCDYWGADVTHTWYWWKKQLRYFMPIVLADVEKTTAAEKPAKKRATRKKATTTKAAATKTTKAAAEKDEKVAEKPAAKAAATKAAASKAAEKDEKAAPAPKTAAKKATAAKPAAPKAAPAKKAPAAKAEKPAAAPATIAKAEKPAAPAKAVKASVPAKAEKPAAPAKATMAAAPAKAAEKPAAKATTKAAPAKPAAKAATAEPEAKPAAKKPAAKKAAAKPAAAAEPVAKKAAAKPAASAPKTSAPKTAKGGTSAKK